MEELRGNLMYPGTSIRYRASYAASEALCCCHAERLEQAVLSGGIANLSLVDLYIYFTTEEGYRLNSNSPWWNQPGDYPRYVRHKVDKLVRRIYTVEWEPNPYMWGGIYNNDEDNDWGLHLGFLWEYE